MFLTQGPAGVTPLSGVGGVGECLAQDGSNVYISPKTSHGVLDCDVTLQKYILMIL